MFDDRGLKRFWCKIYKSSDQECCWNWNAYLNGGGYGSFRVGQRMVLAHRIAYCLANNCELSSIDKLIVRHKCDNRKCCNFMHLELGTQLDNVRDCVARGRFKVNAGNLKGEMCSWSKLTEEDVVEIRRIYSLKKLSQPQISKMYGVCQQQVSDIVNRKRWKHL
jgi:hypothetical protein